MKEAHYCSDLEVLRQSYIIKRKLDIKPLRDALTEKNLEFILRTTGYMIENADAYGFKEIEEIAYNISSSVKEERLQDTFTLIEVLHRYLEIQGRKYK